MYLFTHLFHLYICIYLFLLIRIYKTIFIWHGVRHFGVLKSWQSPREGSRGWQIGSLPLHTSIASNIKRWRYDFSSSFHSFNIKKMTLKMTLIAGFQWFSSYFKIYNTLIKWLFRQWCYETQHLPTLAEKELSSHPPSPRHNWDNRSRPKRSFVELFKLWTRFKIIRIALWKCIYIYIQSSRCLLWSTNERYVYFAAWFGYSKWSVDVRAALIVSCLLSSSDVSERHAYATITSAHPHAEVHQVAELWDLPQCQPMAWRRRLGVEAWGCCKAGIQWTVEAATFSPFHDQKKHLPTSSHMHFLRQNMRCHGWQMPARLSKIQPSWPAQLSAQICTVARAALLQLDDHAMLQKTTLQKSAICTLN